MEQIKIRTIILLLFFILIQNNSYSTVILLSHYITQNYEMEDCEIVFFTKIGWTITEINNDYFEIRRTTDPNWNSWTTISEQINGCGWCARQSYTYIDNGPFSTGVNYYYRLKAVGGWGQVTLMDLGNVSFSEPISKDWKNQTTAYIIESSTSSNPYNYNWHEVSNIIQGVHINLIPAEKVPIYVQQNNCIINFTTRISESQALNFMINIDININDQGYTNIYQGSSRQDFVWNNSTNIFNTLGEYNLKVRFIEFSGIIYYREYDVHIIPASDKLYKDNYCNTLRVWEGNNPGNNIPAVFSEGFDAYDITTQEFYYLIAQDIWDCLRDNGYTIYLLDNKYGTQSIRNNAAGFAAAVRYVSSINNNKKVIAGGASMGGIIARYAFAKAEQDGNPLPASKFVSIDSPQQGAIISKTLQDYKKENQEGDPFSEHALNNDAAKQLSNYNTYDPNAETLNSIHNLFYNELNSLNGDGYPHLTENIGITFANNQPNPYSGKWIEIRKSDWYGGGIIEDFDLTPEEKVPGSYLCEDLTTMSPIIMRGIDWFGEWSWVVNITPIQLLNYPYVSVVRYKHPTYVSYESALDIVNGESKFDVTIEPEFTSFHDVVPEDIVNPIVSAIIFDNNKYLQNAIIFDNQDFYAINSITAGKNVTNTLPVGDFIIADGANVTFTAGEEINLEPGFESGYYFETFISDVDLIDCFSKKIVENEKQPNRDTFKLKNNVFSLFECNPNPFDNSTEITFKIEEKTNAKLYLINTYGINIIELMNNRVSEGIHKVHISGFSLPSGIYYCILETKDYRKHIKIIKI